ncbi:MAG: hypothetical protein BHW55_01745 [Candidatus Melainabacteria bacterium 35_41]|jgi:channel protein, hemolysin III family|nr:MAG: hypothetical protein BHW55_01745 [Candidatus Melainabacteria bacterium 35_41]
MSELTRYTKGEEFVNASTHAIGALLSIYGIVMLAAASRNALEASTTAIFGATLFILFQSSTLYHAMVNETAKRVFRKIDHSAIFLLIAGTYTPILLLVLPFPHSIAILAMIWYIALSGIIYSCITLKFKYLSTVLYLMMGWLMIFLIYKIWNTKSHQVVWLLLGGGAVYSLGSVFYLIKKKYMHSIWHIFVILGAVLHYFAILELLKM